MDTATITATATVVKNPRRLVTRTSGRKSRGEMEVGRHLTVAAALIALSVPALGQSLALAIVKSDAAQASAFVPWDGWVAAANSLAEMQSALRPAEVEAQIDKAASALRREPLAVKALVVLGTQAQLTGDKDRSREIFAQSAALSRRNLQTHLWVIQDAVDRGDISRALTSYDLAFRTSSVAQSMLFPVLASAVEEPKVRKQLVARLASRPPWSSDFLEFATRNSTNPQGVILLVDDMERKGLTVRPRDRRELVNLLFRQGGADAAWQYYRTLGKLPSCGPIRHPKFDGPSESPTVFDWIVPEEASTFVIGNAAGSSEGLGLDVPPNVRSVLLRQIARLCPGVYRLEGSATQLSMPAGSELFWRVSCAANQEIARVRVSARADGRSAYGESFKIPSGCATQTVELMTRSSGSPQGMIGNLLSVRTTAE